ncbi:MAG: AAA family ATPase [Candidatus Gracilibacteria bacterium]
MKIKNVKINNFKCFSDFNFSPINNDLNLLVGENGVGKSTVFEAIRILLDSNLSLRDYFTDEDFNIPENPISLEIDITFDISFKNLVDISDYLFDIDEENIYVRLGFIIQKYKNYSDIGNKEENEKLKSFNEGFYYSRISIHDIPLEIPNKIEFLYEKYKTSSLNLKKVFNIIYIDGSRSYKHFYEPNSEFSNLIKDEKNHLETIEVLKSGFDTEILTSPGFENFFAGIVGNINDEIKKVSLVNDYEIKSSLSIETPDNKLPFRILKNLLKINLDGPIPLEKNSIGWQYIYFTIFTLFSLKNNDDCFNVFLMEEPEAHLHPQMQRKLFNYINNRENSIIYVSTHSQTIVRTIKDIKKTNLIQINSSKSLPLISGFDSLNVNKLNTFIDINKAELFFARGVIFVEGISEEILLPKLFEKKFGYKIEDYGISIVNINGTDFIEYANLCKQYNIPFVIITDKDLINESGIIKEDYFRRIIGLYSEILFVADIDTFEIDLLHGDTEGNNKVFFENIFEKEFGTGKLDNSKANMDSILISDKSNIAYIDLKESFFSNYISSKNGISKSQFAYYGYEYLGDNGINIPNYINNAFEKIISISLKKGLGI